MIVHRTVLHSTRCALLISSMLLVCGRFAEAQAPAKRPASGQATSSQPSSAPRSAPAGTGFPAAKVAQKGVAPSGNAPRERPEAAPLQVENLPQELLDILNDWEMASAKFKTLQGEHNLIVYINEFAIEQRGSGRFWYQTPDKGRYEVEPAVVKQGEKNPKKKTAEGVEFTIQPHEAQKWICNGLEVFQINDEKKEFERIVIPPEDRGTNIINGPLPFVFGMKADHARRRYFLKLIKHENGEIWLQARPRMQRDAALWQAALVVLNDEKFLPKAVKLTDPTGKKETVHLFSNLKLNGSLEGWLRLPGLTSSNPFEFNPKGYKQVILDSAEGTEPQPQLAGPKREPVRESAPGPRPRTPSSAPSTSRTADSSTAPAASATKKPRVIQ